MSSTSSEDPSDDPEDAGKSLPVDYYTVAPLAGINENILAQDLTDPLDEINENILAQDLTDPLAGINENILAQDLTNGSATLPTLDHLGLITPNQLGRVPTTSKRQPEVPSQSESPSLRTLELLNWTRLRAKIRVVLRIMSPILGLLSLIQSCRLSQEARRLQKQAHEQRRYEHRKILANQRENSQRLDEIERQIEATDNGRYITIVGKRSEVRTSPDSQAVITSRLRRDTQVEPITIDDGWVRIRYVADGEEHHGWIAARYLDTVETEE